MWKCSMLSYKCQDARIGHVGWSSSPALHPHPSPPRQYRPILSLRDFFLLSSTQLILLARIYFSNTSLWLTCVRPKLEKTKICQLCQHDLVAISSNLTCPNFNLLLQLAFVSLLEMILHALRRNHFAELKETTWTNVISSSFLVVARRIIWLMYLGR